ncbi:MULTISPECIES: hypothetical protein [unclassified Enterobacter]|uniref:hypothetical protein n=1 Tax=unclassified Enterobacter TaxID=2608935 RepID=UPI0011CE668E|nr:MULTISPECIES: hypothetical protein [unclassified Enterobacter]
MTDADISHQSLSGGLSYTFGAGGGPGVNISYSRDKMKSNYDSVQELTGIQTMESWYCCQER